MRFVIITFRWTLSLKFEIHNSAPPLHIGYRNATLTQSRYQSFPLESDYLFIVDATYPTGEPRSRSFRRTFFEIRRKATFAILQVQYICFCFLLQACRNSITLTQCSDPESSSQKKTHRRASGTTRTFSLPAMQVMSTNERRRSLKDTLESV